jgi:probable HAF family extracellular repeat protein
MDLAPICTLTFNINRTGTIVVEEGFGTPTIRMWVPDTPNGSVGKSIVLEGLPGNNGVGTGTAINDEGKVVGYSVVNNQRRPFLWTPDDGDPTTGVMAPLSLLPGVTSAAPTAINSHGEIVSRGALLWNADGDVFDLNALVNYDAPVPWTLTDAFDMNDAGQIIAATLYDFDNDGLPDWRCFLLTPVPEPGVALPMATTLVIASSRRQGRRDTASGIR